MLLPLLLADLLLLALACSCVGCALFRQCRSVAALLFGVLSLDLIAARLYPLLGSRNLNLNSSEMTIRYFGAVIYQGQPLGRKGSRNANNP